MKASLNIMVIKYPNGAKQVIKPNPHFFNGDYVSLAKSVVGLHYVNNRGEVGNIPFELK